MWYVCCPQSHTSLFVHEQIIKSEESSELGGSMGEDLEHIWQEATLGKDTVWYSTHYKYTHIYSHRRWEGRWLGVIPSSQPPPSAPRCRRAGFSCKAQDSDWFSPLRCCWSSGHWLVSCDTAYSPSLENRTAVVWTEGSLLFVLHELC